MKEAKKFEKKWFEPWLVLLYEAKKLLDTVICGFKCFFALLRMTFFFFVLFRITSISNSYENFFNRISINSGTPSVAGFLMNVTDSLADTSLGSTI